MRYALLLTLVACVSTPAVQIEYPDVWIVAPSSDASEEPTVELIEARGVEAPDRTSWDAAIDAARRQYRDLDFDASRELVADALERFIPDARDESDVDRIHQLHLLRAMNELALGRADAARTAIADALALRPETQLDEGRFPPDVRALHGEVAATLGEARGEIAVDSAPSGARLLLDGRFVGNAPLSVEASLGHHHLRCESLGYAERRLRAEWSGTQRRVRIELDALRGEALIAQIATATSEALRSLPPDAIRALGATLEGRVLVRLEQQDASWVAVVIDPDAEATRDLSLDAGDQRAAIGELLAQIRPLPEPPPRDPRRRRRILGSVLGGIALVGAALAVGLVLRPEPDPVLVWPRPERE